MSKVLLNDDALIQILSLLPTRDLLLTIPLVCKKFNGFVKQNFLWEVKCKNHGVSTGNVQQPVTGTYKELYFNSEYGQNLLKNPCALESYDHWNVEKNGGHGFEVEAQPTGCVPLPEEALIEWGNPCIKNWVTSYEECEKSQTVGLQGTDFEALIDKCQPEIRASEWFASRFDCGCKYTLIIQLLDRRKSVIKEEQFKETLKASRGPWRKAEIKLTDYGKGVCYIKFIHCGQDTKWWAGHYGAKFTLASVCFKFSFTTTKKTSRRKMVTCMQ